MRSAKCSLRPEKQLDPLRCFDTILAYDSRNRNIDKDITLPRICLWPTDRYGAMHIAHASRVKIVPLYFVQNFPKCISILKIISPTDYSSNYAVKSSWKIPPRFKRVTTIPRDLSLITISVSDCRQSADNNISQASVRSYALEMWRDLWLSLYSIQIFGRVRFKEFWKKISQHWRSHEQECKRHLFAGVQRISENALQMYREISRFTSVVLSCQQDITVTSENGWLLVLRYNADDPGWRYLN